MDSSVLGLTSLSSRGLNLWKHGLWQQTLWTSLHLLLARWGVLKVRCRITERSLEQSFCCRWFQMCWCTTLCCSDTLKSPWSLFYQFLWAHPGRSGWWMNPIIYHLLVERLLVCCKWCGYGSLCVAVWQIALYTTILLWHVIALLGSR